jgi:hypothetical protein
MRYRDARLLKEGDEVVRKDDNATMILSEVQVFGQYKKVKLVCYLKDDAQQEKLYYYHDALVGEEDEA